MSIAELIRFLETEYSDAKEFGPTEKLASVRKQFRAGLADLLADARKQGMLEATTPDKVDPSGRLMRKGLVHRYAGVNTDEFLRLVDQTGGWPLGLTFAGFEHTTERAAGFCNTPMNTGWWTVVASADDYYLWKLSPECLQRVADAVHSSMRIPKVDASKLWVRDTQGHRACLASAIRAAAEGQSHA